jgi:hypothetical protein
VLFEQGLADEDIVIPALLLCLVDSVASSASIFFVRFFLVAFVVD